jgi:putative nucleotidyltransferase with HDIG domain
MEQNQGDTGAAEQARWRRRPAIAAMVRLAIVGLPVAVSVAVAVTIELLVTKPSSAVGLVAWWFGVLGASFVVLLGCERLARRALPLAALLKMGMLFPGVAPKRLAIARRAASTRDLERRLEEARSKGMDDEPVVAAERIVALAASLSAHDRKTRGHTERVRALTDLVADELRLPEADRDRLRWSALLHDVGKLAVHPDVLNKEGPLSDEEWDLMRQHPLEGAKLTAPLASWLGEWAATIAEHHERYDGGGYPFGLAGDAISLGGRIVAVADTYDVMTSARSYKRPSSPEVARSELVRCAGSQFDPAVVRAFLAVPIRRLRGLLPVSWLGSLPFGDFGSGVALVGRTGVALVAAGSIVGVATLKPGQLGVAAIANDRGGAGGQLNGASGVGSSTAGTKGKGVHGSQSNGSGSTGQTGGGADGSGGGAGGSGSSGHGSSAKNGSTGTGGSPEHQGNSGPGAGSGSSTTSPNSPGTTVPGSPPTSSPGSPPTTSPGSPPTTSPGSPPTTSPGSPPTTTTSVPPTTTTTTTVLPAPSPPTGLSATGSCQVIIVGPVINLSWTDSTSNWVTGYDILRSSNGSSYTGIASVSAGTTTYSDKTVSGLNTRYWYEVEALSPEGYATSSAASATTPPLCL